MAAPVIFDQYTGLEFVLHGSAHDTETEEPVAIIAAAQGGALYLVPSMSTSRFQRSGAVVEHLADQAVQDPTNSREPGHGPTGFLYRHKKTGGFYRLQGTALHFFNGKAMALYSAAQGGFFYARSLEQFQERFEPVPDTISAVETAPRAPVAP